MCSVGPVVRDLRTCDMTPPAMVPVTSGSSFCSGGELEATWCYALTLISRAAFPGKPKPTGVVIRQQGREEWAHRPIAERYSQTAAK